MSRLLDDGLFFAEDNIAIQQEVERMKKEEIVKESSRAVIDQLLEMCKELDEEYLIKEIGRMYKDLY